MSLIVAFDPGTTSGIAIRANSEIVTMTIAGDKLMKFVHEELDTPDLFIVEPFRTAGMLSKYGLQTIDLAGQLKGWALAKGVDVVIYTPQSRKAWIFKAEQYPARYKRIIHEIDALAHLLHYCEVNKLAV